MSLWEKIGGSHNLENAVHFSLSELLQAEQAAVTSEFESYKVRVHNVLKQQKTKSVSQTETDGAKQER